MAILLEYGVQYFCVHLKIDVRLISHTARMPDARLRTVHFADDPLDEFSRSRVAAA